MKCDNCAGTGDKYDFDNKEWVIPWEKCPRCEGHGEVEEDDTRWRGL